ncbi:MAG: prepilin-type N-terminal cleavage/methylation domain-containing protein [Phycisphaeraceae bacterium]|nr:prepilin-type N-terminal cleavage/methylation domain-containing protein [Phycisphaeraceae bacterium]
MTRAIRQSNRARTSGRGFSLVELIVVIVLISLLAAVAIPSLSRAADSRARAGVEQLRRDLEGARDMACHGGVRTWVVFSIAQQRYECFIESPSNPGRAGRTPRTDPATGRPFSQPIGGPDWSNVSLVSVSFNGGTEIAFDWQGRPLSMAEQPLTSNGQVTFSNGRSLSVSHTNGSVSSQ